jgi:hypothetical protein
MLTLTKTPARFLPTLKAISLGLLLLMGSCSNPRDASKDNFKKIIGQYIKNEKVCTAGNYQLPEIIADSAKDERKKQAENTLDLFIKQGWVKVEKRAVSTIPFSPPEMSTVYELTPEGAKNSIVKMFFRGGFGRENTTYYTFCYAQGKEIIDINAFGEPTEEKGQKIVKVPFTYKVTGKKDDWVDKYPDKSKFISDINSDRVTLRLTNEGWQALGRTEDLERFSDLLK